MGDMITGGWGLRATVEAPYAQGRTRPETADAPDDAFATLLAPPVAARPPRPGENMDDEAAPEALDHPAEMEPVRDGAGDVPPSLLAVEMRPTAPPFVAVWASASSPLVTPLLPEASQVSGVVERQTTAAPAPAELADATAQGEADALRVNKMVAPDLIGSAGTGGAKADAQSRLAEGRATVTSSPAPTQPASTPSVPAWTAGDRSGSGMAAWSTKTESLPPAPMDAKAPSAAQAALAAVAGPAQRALGVPLMRQGTDAKEDAGPGRATTGPDRTASPDMVIARPEVQVPIGPADRSGPVGAERSGVGPPWPLHDAGADETGEGEARGAVPVGPLAPQPVDGGVALNLAGGASEGRRTALSIAKQVSVQSVLRSGGATEMRLAPKELGQLRLRVEIEDGGLRVLIEAARPDIADLMRRHVETLRQELRSEGLGSVSVSIEGGSPERGSDAGQGRSPGPERSSFWPGSADPDPSPCPLPHRSRATAGQLDLRF